MVISKVTEEGLVQATQLRIKLTAPPKTPTPPPSPQLTDDSDGNTIRDKISRIGRPGMFGFHNCIFYVATDILLLKSNVSINTFQL